MKTIEDLMIELTKVDHNWIFEMSWGCQRWWVRLKKSYSDEEVTCEADRDLRVALEGLLTKAYEIKNEVPTLRRLFQMAGL